MEVNMDEFITLREASDLFGKSQSTLRKIHYNNEVESVKKNNKLLVKISDLEAIYGEVHVPKASDSSPLIIDPKKSELRDIVEPQPTIETETTIVESFSINKEMVEMLNKQIDSLKEQVTKLETVQVEKDRYYQKELEDSKQERQEYMNELSRQISLFNEKWEREQVLYLKQTEANQKLMEANRIKDQQINELIRSMNEIKQEQLRTQQEANQSWWTMLSKWLSETF